MGDNYRWPDSAKNDAEVQAAPTELNSMVMARHFKLAAPTELTGPEKMAMVPILLKSKPQSGGLSIE